MQLRGLHDIRLGQALSMRELSQRSGVSPSTIVAAEQGKPVYSVTVRKLAKALGVSPSELRGDALARAPGRLPTVPPTPLDVSLDLAHALQEAEWARRDGDMAEARRWEQIAADIAGSAESVQ
jgi:transcriptional regulator with XRE-family HTH domain